MVPAIVTTGITDLNKVFKKMPDEVRKSMAQENQAAAEIAAKDIRGGLMMVHPESLAGNVGKMQAALAWSVTGVAVFNQIKIKYGGTTQGYARGATFGAKLGGARRLSKDPRRRLMDAEYRQFPQFVGNGSHIQLGVAATSGPGRGPYGVEEGVYSSKEDVMVRYQQGIEKVLRANFQTV